MAGVCKIVSVEILDNVPMLHAGRFFKQDCHAPGSISWIKFVYRVPTHFHLCVVRKLSKTSLTK